MRMDVSGSRRIVAPKYSPYKGLLVLAVALAAASAGAPAARAQEAPETSPNPATPGEVPSPDIPLPERETSSYTFVPVPIVYSDPNVGTGFGAMPVLLIHPTRRIDWIFAPSIDYNEIVGTALTSRIYFYPTIQEEFVAFNAVTTGRNFEHSMQFRGHDRLVDGTDLFARGYYIRDGTKRFYGFGSGTDAHDESDYELTELGIEGDFGFRFWDVLRVSGTSRYRQTSVRKGILDDLPDTVAVFPGLPGTGSSTDLLAIGTRITLDFRDDVAIPNDGLFADGFVEVSPKGLVSDTRFTRWGASFVHHLPVLRPGTWVHITRARYSAIDGDGNFPFYEYPSLGGSENLRGFGVGRFTDTNYLVFSLEERVRFAELVIRDNLCVFEAAPFFDFGRVYGEGEGGDLSRHDWVSVPGVGMRMLLPDSSIVARLDLGYSFDEGAAIFVVLGYPF
jgi:hypothetical protein